ncbi:PSD1 and planctomycete cytochrome C domain-containing protein [Blastopirellula marina]|nr:PSD1 and planctomycete cytochrome C domain-containing protein [Blastopirellula marina]
MRNRLLALGMIGLSLVSTSRGEEKPPVHASEKYDYFETSVRPLLIAACGNCHGEKKQHAGLRTDSLTGLLDGGDSGAAIVPGDVEGSLLIASVRRTGDYKMPPDKPLTPEQVAILERWVEMGAPWTPGDSRAKQQSEARDTHWAFQSIAQAIPPEIEAQETIETPVDQFIQAKLQQKNIQLAPLADRATLIRRVTYDLTGLPPTYQQVQDFVNDSSPDAYAHLVERLLASPAYGEHWARYWLDLARYSDTKGYVYAREERRFVHAWNYRDWVVEAFNRNMPYNEFLLNQLAADQYRPDDSSAQAAMGFITIGRRFLGNTHDIIDDRIDVVGRTTMGLTLGCARCHDHKYDPIPTADYYSLYGVFQNCSEALTPLDAERLAASDSEVVKEFLTRRAALESKIEEKQIEVSNRIRARIADYLFAQTELGKYPEVSFNQIIAKEDMVPAFVHQFRAYLERTRKTNDPVFIVWNRLADIPEDQFSADAPQVLAELRQMDAGAVNSLVLQQFQETPTSMRDVADRYGELLHKVAEKYPADVAEGNQRQDLPPEERPLWEVLFALSSPCRMPEKGITGTEFYYDDGTTIEIWKLQAAVDQWLIDHAEDLPHTVRLVDRANLTEPHVFRRGNPANRGQEITRHFPTLIAGDDSPPFAHGSGRMELAQGIVAEDNPLTARVWVNRIWQHHFGVGLVPTSSDFGTRAPEPAHRELLDWLATQLIESGWDTRKIHRLILLSYTYRQSSLGPDQDVDYQHAKLTDPENRLLWKMNPHRLSFEELRDTMLAVSNQLDLRRGGPGATLFDANDSHKRRTLYGYVDRQFLPSVFRVFDFANPDLHIPNRSETTVAQQALFGLNHAFVAQRAHDLAGMAERNGKGDLTQAVSHLFQAVYQRQPTTPELDLARQFIEEAQPASQQPTEPKGADQWAYGYATVTDNGLQADTFKPLPYFNGTAWQGGEQWPDSNLGWAQLTAAGGHPGNTEEFAVVRRWSPDANGTFSVQSKVAHAHAVGNGIRCWIISSRHGILKKFALHNSSQEDYLEGIKVDTGDTLDFVVDINGNLNSDDFDWSIDIARTPVDVTSISRWNALDDFPKQPVIVLTPLEQLAQALLLSNELMFVD